MYINKDVIARGALRSTRHTVDASYNKNNVRY